MASQGWVNLLDPAHPAVGAVIGTFTTFRDVSPLPLPIVDPTMLHVGSVIYLEADGEFSTTGTPTLSMGFMWNAAAGGTTGTVLAQSAAITTGTATAWPVHVTYRGKVVNIGATGSIVGQGHFDLGTSLTRYQTTGPEPIPSTQALRTVTIDTTASRLLAVCAAYGTSNALNTVKINNFVALLLN